ncbi:hypothetical protein ABW19_dt0207224 [Dactylella cylindrospora]|nr:hypothetical protein ABW19_dt0207224 [Dactylella cylindrospora]
MQLLTRLLLSMTLLSRVLAGNRLLVQDVAHIPSSGARDTLENEVPLSAATGGEKSPVPVEMFVMSMCPDARDCVKALILPTMAQIYDTGIISLRPTYIGQPDDSNAGVACMHGPNECLGDILELCAYEMYKSNPRIWLGFINCLGEDYRSIPDDDYVHRCANNFGVDFEKLEECAASDDPDKGVELLRTSTRRAIELDVKVSCTVQVRGKTVCVRDSGEWKIDTCKGPQDLIREVQNAYNEQ